MWHSCTQFLFNSKDWFYEYKRQSCEEKDFVIDRMKPPTFSCVSLDTQSRYMTRDREAIASVSFSGFKHIILHVIDPCCIRCCASFREKKIVVIAISTIIIRRYGDITFLTIRSRCILYFNVILYSLIFFATCVYKYCMESNGKFDAASISPRPFMLICHMNYWVNLAEDKFYIVRNICNVKCFIFFFYRVSRLERRERRENG